MDKVKQHTRMRYAFAAHLAANGLRCTPERLRVLEVSLSLKGRFTSLQLVEHCAQPQDEAIAVSRATVFNTLPHLESSGIVRRLAHDREITYEVVGSKKTQKGRQHLVCRQCGKARRLEAPLLSAWVEHQTFRDFHPEADSSVLYIYGLCSRCQRLNRQQQKNN